MHPDRWTSIGRTYGVVVLAVGIVVGTCIGIAEGFSVLLSQELFGRYNELVAWAIVIDAGAMTGLEIALGFLSALFFLLLRRVPAARGLVSLLLGETVAILVVAFGLWSQLTVDPSRLVHDALGVLIPSALIGILLGELVLAGSMWATEHAPLIRHARVRHWFVFEAVVLALAVAFALVR